MSKVQDADTDLSRIKQRVKLLQDPPNAPEIQTYSREARRFMILWEKLSVKSDVLYLTIKTISGIKKLPIVPRDQYLNLCIHIHKKLAHTGFHKLFQCLRQTYAVFGIGKIAKHCTKSCDDCQKMKNYT